MSLDLHSRISMINRMNGYDTPAPVEPTEKELEAEEALVVASEEADKSSVYATASTVNTVVDEEVPETKETDFSSLLAAIEDLKSEIIKMNKHIISIQKFIKKNS